MNLRQWLALVGLTCSTFIFNTSEFMPIGLLSDIARSFSLTEAGAGVMVSVYAWAVMLLSLPLMVAASRVEHKKLLLAIIALFGAGQALSAVAPTYAVLVAARLLVACAHAVFWSVVSVLATRVAGARQGSLALGVVATGGSVAMIAGLPLGRLIGLAVGWRVTFAVVAAAALCVLVYLAAVFPRLEKTEAFSLTRLPGLLHNRSLLCLYGVAILFSTGYYTGYSYIEPFLAQVGGFAPGAITVALTVFGAAGLLGSALFSRFYDARRGLFLCATAGGVACALLTMRVAALVPCASMALCVLWGSCGTAFNVGCQSEIIKTTDCRDAAVAMSMFSGLFNLGIGSGTAIGGAVVEGVSMSAVGYVGGVIALLGFLAAVKAYAHPTS